ncbi:MAG: 50S ribosomal protein L32e [Candidatus Aenigmarchaeota archaeon]|nr:50S ribosomal protein L32e [Candidatus Aenigmarchaeota archaeon]
MSKRFRRQDSQFHSKLGTKWRAPKGGQSKMRERRGGAGKVPKVGYRTDKSVRGTIMGKKVTYVAGLTDLQKLAKGDTAMLSSSLGMKSVLELAARARELGIEIFNRQRIRTGEKLMKAKEEKKAKEQEAKKQGMKDFNTTKKEKKAE